jgi:hypothetical protein
MRRITTRLSQDDLNYSGANTQHAFQREAVAHMLQYDWHVAGVYRNGRNALVVMRHNKDSAVGAAVYPDGDVDIVPEYFVLVGDHVAHVNAHAEAH